MDGSSTSKPHVKKINSKEFWNISVWVLKTVYKLNPGYTVIYTLATIATKFSGLINTYILAGALDAVVNSVTSGNADYSKVYSFLITLFCFNLWQSFVGLADGLSWNEISIIGRVKFDRAFYKQIESLGIQTLETPDINDRISRANMYRQNVFAYLDIALRIVANGISVIVLMVLLIKVVPLFIPLIILFTLPSVLLDKKYRSLIYTFVNANTEGNRKSEATASDLRDPNKLQEITVTNSFGFLDRKYWDFKYWYSTMQKSLYGKWHFWSISSRFLADTTILVCTGQVLLRAIKGFITIGDTLFQYRMLE